MRTEADGRALVVVAHPDDEVLGCGGTIAAMVEGGFDVTSCILSGEVEARVGRPADGELRADTLAAAECLGMQPPILGSFPNIAMNSVPHIDLVRFIEAALLETRATQVFAVHPGDLNDDHRQVSLACMAAARLSQRREGAPRLRGLHLMEIPSATDWAFAGAGPRFDPTSFVELGPDLLARKLEALQRYRGVMRPFPHPRSEEVVTGLAACRGAQAGMRYAEAFQTIHQDLSCELGLGVRPTR
ncbi:MAG TPA: PIG-L deacetylase family protein [Mycobacteriales bacterium]|nr:PIG-L deacetylase family protein [Mycobacteriales bacterium]